MKVNTTFEATRTAWLLGCCLVGASFGVVGCQNTAEGAKEDAAKNTAAVGNAADKAAETTKNAADNAAMATKDAAANAGDALTLTPKVKAAIVADSKLNNTNNMINVDTKNNTVILKGHVTSNDEKKLAGEIAEKTVKEAGSNDKVMNQLTVQSH